MTAPSTDLSRIAMRYTAFAIDEARGVSEAYERLALGIAASPEILGFIASMPVDRRQPNLFLAAVRHVCGVPENTRHLKSLLRQEHERIRSVIMSRTTQTNEPARCSVLLPVFARLPQPLALLEVGASAGLCLLPDRYGYDYGTRQIGPAVENAPVFKCAASAAVPLPDAIPQIVWRLGLDLNPIDLSSNEQVEWLEALVWPGQEERAEKLRAAIAVARSDPPRIIKGDLLTELPTLVAMAPKGVTLVVFHTAVLPYVARQQREKFAAMMKQGDAVWVSNEAPGLLSFLRTITPSAPSPGRFLMMVDGEPIAWTGPHGQSIDWLTRQRSTADGTKR